MRDTKTRGASGESGSPSLQLPRTLIGRRLAAAFGVVAAIAITMCLTECFLVFRASDQISRMQDLEPAFASGTTLAIAVREQYIHQAHWIIDRDPSHLDHSREAALAVREKIAKLSENADAAERTRLDELADDSNELARVFEEDVVPAVEANDPGLTKKYHAAIDRLSADVNAEADRIAATRVHHMAALHEDAIRTTHLGAWIAALCIGSVLLTSCYFVLKLRRAVVRPLEELARTALALGRGDLQSRVTVAADGELRALALAFNHMAMELSQREARLIHSERMAAIGQLAAGLAHEINNPIGIIRGYLKTMTPNSPPDVLREELRILDEEAAACQRLANDLLDFSRTSTLRLENVDLGILIADTVDRFLELPSAEGRTVRVDARSGMVRIDEGRVRQLVLNLLTNAAQASPHGAPIEIKGAPTDAGGYAFVVADRGAGIPPEAKHKVFEPFFSLSAGGSGLGLTVCQGIVRAHEGTISIQDRDGSGTLVKVVLPASTRPGELQ